MYLPPLFADGDRARLVATIRENAFGTLVSAGAGVVEAGHFPFLIDDAGTTLVCHLAAANPQWRAIEAGADVLAIFSGPHGYVSPRWYQTTPAVPTWNYVAIHVRGQARVTRDPGELRAIVAELTRINEAGAAAPWSIEGLPEAYVAAQLRGIVGIHIAIAGIEGKRKLSQNRPAADRAGVIAALETQGDDASLALARAMNEELAD